MSREQPRPTRRFRRRTALALIALVFALGVLVGILGTHLFYAHRLRQPGAVADRLVDAKADRVADRLELRADQRRQLDRILDDARGDVRALRGELIRDLRQIRDDAVERLRQILDAEQRRELQRLHEAEGLFLDRYLGAAEEPPSPSEKPGS